MLDLNPQHKRLILSLDGGGMRGTITIAMLAELEAMTGRPAYDLFDMIAGTSTGAVIAGALALGQTAEAILNHLYKDKLANAFSRADARLWTRWMRGGLRHLYPIEPFVQALAPITNGIKMGDIERPILLFTTKDIHTGGTFYLTNRGPGAAASADWPLAGAVAASAAAPIFFPPVAGRLVDGGVGADANPCLCAAIEAMEYMGAEEGFTDGNVTLISIGTGYVPFRDPEHAPMQYHALRWLRFLTLDSLDHIAHQQAITTRAIYRHRLDFRRLNVELSRRAAEQLGVETGACDPATLTIDSRSPQALGVMEALGRAYARAIDWTQPNTMPWDTKGGHAKPPGQIKVDWTRTPFG